MEKSKTLDSQHSVEEEEQSHRADMTQFQKIL